MRLPNIIRLETTRPNWWAGEFHSGIKFVYFIANGQTYLSLENKGFIPPENKLHKYITNIIRLVE